MIFQLECNESVECYCTETHVGVIVGVSVRINKWSWGMFGSCSQPIKANKIISCGTRDSQHPIRTAATTKRWRFTISTHVRRLCELRICSSIHGVRNSRFSTSNPNIYEAERQTKSSRLGKVHTSSWLCFQFMEGKERGVRSNGTCTDSTFVEILLHRSAEVQAEARNWRVLRG